MWLFARLLFFFTSEQSARSDYSRRQGWYTRYVLDKTKIVASLHTYEQQAKEYMLSLRDVRNIGSLIFLALVLLISWSGVKAIQTNYALQQQVSRMQQENAVAKLKNTNQKLENEYYNTSQYLEVTARQNFGLIAPGETELLVSKQVAMAHTVPLPSEQTSPKPAKSKPFWQQNFEAWMDFFFHRQQDSNSA